MTLNTEPDPHHTKEFFEQMRGCRDAYRLLADCIHEVVGVQESALDIGCGIGLQTARLKELGWAKTLGAEYTPAAIELREPGVEIIPFDLTAPATGYHVSNTVICTETAEHIPAGFAERIVENVTMHARNLIVWSAASPGQEWPGHVNLQDPGYWLRLFKDKDWVPDHKKTARLRELMVNRRAQHWMGSHNFFVLVPAMLPPHFTVVSTILNGERVIGRCIRSVAEQNYQRVTHRVIDAASVDGTPETVLAQGARWYTAIQCVFGGAPPVRRSFVGTSVVDLSAAEPSATRLHLIVNRPERKAALENLWDAAQGLPDDEVIVWLDGDDWLAHDRALDVLADIYRNPDIWMTFGQFMFPDGEVGFASPYPPGVNPRRDAWRATHLKTFRAGLFKQLKPSDLQHMDGSWVELAIDRAVMYPLLELAKNHWHCVHQVLSVYNLDTAWHVSASQADRARELAEVERLQNLPSYPPLTERPW